MPVHPTTIVDPDASISDEATIWQFCHISSRAVIAQGAMIGQSVFVGKGARIGARSRVQNFANVVEGVVLGEDVFIGPHVTFTNVRCPRVAYPAHGHYLETIVQRGATVGAHATILPGLTLGRFCFVAAGAVVTRDVRDFALVQGNPARQVAWVSESGEKLVREGDWLACPRTGKRYVERDGVLTEAPET